jgi:hypothetical protein
MVSEKAVKGLKKALKDKASDRFETGDVIRWTAAGKYSYAAIKTPAGWYTTASALAVRVGKMPFVLDYDGLLDVLNRAETTDIKIATEWKDI